MWARQGVACLCLASSHGKGRLSRLSARAGQDDLTNCLFHGII